MVHRLKFDLTIKRKDLYVPMRRWHYLFVGKCNGNVIIKLERRSASELDPTEFNKITGIEHIRKMYVSNEVQASGKVFNIYFEEEEIISDKVKVRGGGSLLE